tara:strand:- start:38111 stop:39055 length:945 start_codon:yes stop_codon:yes gene_type:complete
MDNTVNFVYAADENYNKQLLVSINSLLNKFSGLAKIHIIHKNTETIEQSISIFKEFKNLEDIKIYQFIKEDHDFPNIENSHISEATYYRLYIDKYVSNDIENYIYLDADIVCISDPLDEIKKTFDSLNASEYSIAARTELLKANNELKFSNLGISRDKYFNAGVIFVKNSHWIKNDLYLKVLNHIEVIKEKIEFWDQDVLNSFFNGNYMELDKKLNYDIDVSKSINSNYEISSNSVFLHYQGSNKPWNINGSINENSMFYNKEFFTLFNNYYHIVSNYSKGDILNLIKIIFTLKILFIKKPLNFLKQALKGIYK